MLTSFGYLPNIAIFVMILFKFVVSELLAGSSGLDSSSHLGTNQIFFTNYILYLITRIKRLPTKCQKISILNSITLHNLWGVLETHNRKWITNFYKPCWNKMSRLKCNTILLILAESRNHLDDFHCCTLFLLEMSK